MLALFGLFIALWARVPALRVWLTTNKAIVLPRVVWILLTVVIALMIGVEVRRWLSQRQARRQAQVTWKDYKRDTVDGIIWVWTWRWIIPETTDAEDIEKLAYYLIPLCPKCSANLDIRHDELVCPNGHTRQLLPRAYDHSEYHNYTVRIAGEIVRRVRSGEYKSALKRS